MKNSLIILRNMLLARQYILCTGIFNHLRERERDIISFFDSSKHNLKAAIIADVGYIFQSNVHYLYTRMNHQAKHCLGNQ